MVDLGSSSKVDVVQIWQSTQESLPHFFLLLLAQKQSILIS